MKAGIAEIVGIFLLIVGLVAIAAAAWRTSVTFGIAVGGAFTVLTGVITVYVAVQLERKPSS